MTDLSTTWLGLPLAHPVMASSNPLTGTVESLKRLEDAGVSAATLPSLFEEQIEHEEEQLAALVDYGAESFGEAPSGYLPPLPSADTGGRYLRLLEEAKTAVSIPVIASLNGVSEGGWTRYAQRIESAGADALELNVYFIATNPHETGAQVEERYLALVQEVRAAIDIPLAVKIGPFFSSIPNMIKKLAEAGADGVSIFNRFYQPDVDLEELEVVPNIELSTSSDVRLPLRWTAILKGPGGHPDRRHQRGSHLARCRQVPAGGRGRHDDGGGALAVTRQRRRRSARRSPVVDDRAGVLVGSTDEGFDEPGERGSAGRLRARQLLAGIADVRIATALIDFVRTMARDELPTRVPLCT